MIITMYDGTTLTGSKIDIYGKELIVDDYRSVDISLVNSIEDGDGEEDEDEDYPLTEMELAHIAAWNEVMEGEMP